MLYVFIEIESCLQTVRILRALFPSNFRNPNVSRVPINPLRRETLRSKRQKLLCRVQVLQSKRLLLTLHHQMTRIPVRTAIVVPNVLLRSPANETHLCSWKNLCKKGAVRSTEIPRLRIRQKFHISGGT